MELELQRTVIRMWETRARDFPGWKVPQDLTVDMAKEIADKVAVDHRIVLRWVHEAETLENSSAKPLANSEGNTKPDLDPPKSPDPTHPSSGNGSGNGKLPVPKPPLAPHVQPTLQNLLPKVEFTQRDYVKSQTVFVPDSAESREVHLAVSGRFLTFTTEYGSTVGLEVIRQDDLFGYDCLWGKHKTMATCLDAGTTLSWPAQQLEQLAESEAKFGVALFRMLLERSLTLYRRIDQFASMKIAQRLAAFLVELGERESQGEAGSGNGAIKLEPYTHELLSEFVGTSREIVTHYMNEFRRLGYLRYSRKWIHLYNPDELLLWTARQERGPESEK